MNQVEFLAKQAEVYRRFQDTTKIRTDGIEPKVPRFGGYLVIFRHSPDTDQAIGDFSRRIANVVPAIAYDAEAVHITISDYMLSEGFEADNNILEKLGRATSSIQNQTAPLINYSHSDYPDWLYNQNTVIVPGVPDKRFLGLAKIVLEKAREEGIELRLPWGAHTTTNRFTQKRSPRELEDFFRLMKEAPKLGENTPRFVDVGYFNFTLYEVKVKVVEDLRVRLK